MTQRLRDATHVSGNHKPTKSMKRLPHMQFSIGVQIALVVAILT